jgi:NADH-quinone oxidoreductase subunit J
MPVTQIVFYILSAISIAGACLVVFSKNPVYSALSLVVTFFAIAGHYFLLNSTFLAAVHIIVYAGAIMVLFLYVIMMLNLNLETEPNKPMWVKIGAAVSGGLLMLVLIASLRGVETMQMSSTPNDEVGYIKNLGLVLYRQYLLPFEVSSVLFLAGMVGAVMLGKKEIQ